MSSRCVLVEQLSGTRFIETVLLGDDTFTQSVGDVVRAQQRGDDDSDLSGDETEGSNVPCLHRSSFEFQVLRFATR